MTVNKTAKTLKILGVAVIIVCLFGGMALGSQFSMSIALICWISGLVFGMLLFGLGEVIDLLQQNAEQQRGILERLVQKEKQKSPQNSFNKLA